MDSQRPGTSNTTPYQFQFNQNKLASRNYGIIENKLNITDSTAIDTSINQSTSKIFKTNPFIGLNDSRYPIKRMNQTFDSGLNTSQLPYTATSLPIIVQQDTSSQSHLDNTSQQQI